MDSRKIIFVSMPRSGSTYMCSLARECLASADVDFIRANPEISNIEQWKYNRQHIIEDNADIINKLKLDSSSIDSNFVNTMFLYYTTQPKPVVLKYFPLDSYDVSVDELIAVSKKHNIRLFGLYRQNILEYFISKIVVYNIGDSEIRNEQLMLSTDFKYDPKILEYDIVEAHQLYIDIYNKLKNMNMLEAVFRYERLTFNTTKDYSLLHNNKLVMQKRNLTEKIVPPTVVNRVLEHLPFLKSELQHSLKQHGIPVVDNFYFSLEK